jgi:hypothetical protein
LGRKKEYLIKILIAMTKNLEDFKINSTYFLSRHADRLHFDVGWTVFFSINFNFPSLLYFRCGKKINMFYFIGPGSVITNPPTAPCQFRVRVRNGVIFNLGFSATVRVVQFEWTAAIFTLLRWRWTVGGFVNTRPGMRPKHH